MERGAYDVARRYLHAAREWPERMGQGRPYAPEERLVQYLLGDAEQRLGEPDRARAAFEAVIDATGQTAARAGRLDVLAIPALVALGRTDAVGAIWNDTETAVGRFGVALIRALENGTDVQEATARLAGEHPALFDDLLGRMLLRTLALSP